MSLVRRLVAIFNAKFLPAAIIHERQTTVLRTWSAAILPRSEKKVR